MDRLTIVLATLPYVVFIAVVFGIPAFIVLSLLSVM